MFWERFYNLCIQNNEKPLQVVRNLNIASGSITKWKNGSIPSGSNLILISDYFNVSIDYLLGKIDVNQPLEGLYWSKKIIQEKNGKLKLKLHLMKMGSDEKSAENLSLLIENLVEHEKGINTEPIEIRPLTDEEEEEYQKEHPIEEYLERQTLAYRNKHRARIKELEKQLEELEKTEDNQ